MSKTAYPLRLPASIKAAATRLAKADGVSLNQFIAVAVAPEGGRSADRGGVLVATRQQGEAARLAEVHEEGWSWGTE